MEPVSETRARITDTLLSLPTWIVLGICALIALGVSYNNSVAERLSSIELKQATLELTIAHLAAKSVLLETNDSKMVESLRNLELNQRAICAATKADCSK